MKALVYTGPLELQLRDVEEPAPVAGEELVQVNAVGICGSELEGFASQSPFRVPPLIMGHEFSGMRVRDGAAIVVNPLVYCGACDMCLRGMQNVCRSRKILGIQIPGAYAEFVSVPMRNIYLAPEGMTAINGALTEPIANAIHALRLAMAYDPTPLRVGVVGGGALGLATVLVALSRGIAHVAASDLSEERMQTLRGVGAHEVGRSLSGEFDIVVDAVGSSTTRAQSLELVRPGGSVVWLGLHETNPGFDGLALIRQEKRVLGSFCYSDADFRAAIPMASKIDPFWVASSPLSEGVDVFTSLLKGPVASNKTMLIPDFTRL